MRNSEDGSLHFVCLDWRHLPELLAASSRVYSEFKNLCVWVKESGGQGSLYRSRHELVFVFKNGKAKHRNNIQLGQYGRYRTNVWEYPRVNSLARNGEERLPGLHPTIKPAAMVADAILDCTSRNDIVLDPFLGSGTTVIAAERTGRICYGMELDPSYVDAIIRRWQAFTGKKAVHEKSGRTFAELEEEASMKDDPKSEKYDVGYGKPPKHAQFKKGQSGNRQRATKRDAQSCQRFWSGRFERRWSSTKTAVAR